MQTGKLVEWRADHGFINRDDNPDPERWDAFVHISALRQAGVHEPRAGLLFEYETRDTGRGRPEAFNLRELGHGEPVTHRGEPVTVNGEPVQA